MSQTTPPASAGQSPPTGKPTFPTVRKGYDPDAVDRHVGAMSQQVSGLSDQLASTQQLSDQPAADIASLKASRPAILKDISFESTSW